MRSKKNKHEGSNKLKMAGAASLHREGNNNSELGQIVANNGHVPQFSVGTPNGISGSAGLQMRKAESNIVKVNANPL